MYEKMHFEKHAYKDTEKHKQTAIDEETLNLFTICERNNLKKEQLIL